METRAGAHAGPLTLTATSPGLRPASVTIRAHAAATAAQVTAAPPATVARTAGPPRRAASGGTPAGDGTTPRNLTAPDLQPAADASYSGAPGTVPAAMLDWRGRRAAPARAQHGSGRVLVVSP
ncbi:MAG: hypothetical protein ACJ72W_07340 [Actinoallomurus sp.]